MRSMISKATIVFLPFLATLSWATAAEGCARGDDEPMRSDDVRTEFHPVPVSDAAQALFPVDPGEDASASDCADQLAINPHSEIAVAYDGGDSSSFDVGTSNVCTVPVTLSYVGPATPGSLWVEAWWQPPSAPPRPWGVISECVDVVPGDGLLGCTFNVPCGTMSFEFQVYLPNARYWGDTSSTTGGHGSTVGTVSLRTPSGPLAYVMIPNPWGNPWQNGFVSAVD